MEKSILLTFDLEEFDIPAEYGHPVTEKDQVDISLNGLMKVLGLLEKHNITATFFTTSAIAGSIPEMLRNMSTKHEIASHSRTHTGFSPADPSISKQVIEEIIRKPVNGFRMPRFGNIDLTSLRSAGFKFDSSINPTFIPGRYNNFFTKRNPYIDPLSDLIEFPLSVSPLIRFPLFWLSFKNIPFSIYAFLCRQALKKDSYIHLCFHTWEFEDINQYGLPRYIRTISGIQLLERLEKLIIEFNKYGSFTTVTSYLNQHNLER